MYAFSRAVKGRVPLPTKISLSRRHRVSPTGSAILGGWVSQTVAPLFAPLARERSPFGCIFATHFCAHNSHADVHPSLTQLLPPPFRRRAAPFAPFLLPFLSLCLPHILCRSLEDHGTSKWSHHRCARMPDVIVSPATTEEVNMQMGGTLCL